MSRKPVLSNRSENCANLNPQHQGILPLVVHINWFEFICHKSVHPHTYKNVVSECQFILSTIEELLTPPPLVWHAVSSTMPTKDRRDPKRHREGICGDMLHDYWHLGQEGKKVMRYQP